MIPRSRDPWWGLDGRSAKRSRRTRQALLAIVGALALVLLAMILARLPSVDARSIVLGPTRNVVFGALLADVAACCLIVARHLRAVKPA